MGLKCPPGVQLKGGTVYRRFKVKREGRWVDLYWPLPPLGDPRFAKALAKANAAAAEGKLDGREIHVRDDSHKQFDGGG